MPKPRVYKTQAIVLRQRKLGEADKIVTLYTSHGGRVDAVAKGVRRTKSKLAGHLEPLTLGSYLLAEGRELDIVTQAETVDAFPGLREDLERLSRGLYCAELVDRLTPERSEGNPIFRLLHETLGYLGTSPGYELAVRRFELRLMDQLGYRPALSACAVCDSAVAASDELLERLRRRRHLPQLHRRFATTRPAEPQRPEDAAADRARQLRGRIARSALRRAGLGAADLPW